jgi:hypothetical protein
MLQSTPYSKFLYLPTDAQFNCLKNNFKIYIKIHIKTAPTCFGVITIIRKRSLMMVITPKHVGAVLRNVNFNVKFKIDFKTIQFHISW